MNQDSSQFSNDPIMRFMRELQKVRSDQRSLVLVTNGFLELLVESLIRAKCKNHKRILDDSRSYPYSAKLLLLNETGIIKDSSYKILDWFRKIRNKAAHEPFFQVTAEDLKSLDNQSFRDPNLFFQMCFGIFGELWNDHIDIFRPLFAPNITSTKEDEK